MVLAVGGLLVPVLAFGTIDLRSFSAWDVPSGNSFPARVDSVVVQTRVGAGLATSVVTLVVTPYACDATTYGARDSIELSTGFQLPADFAAKNMWLWVNGEPVTAYIQDRALADSQYTSIVGRRRDPAILSTWGNGYYNLRIFPTSLNKSRRIAIEFQHTFDDDTLGLIRAAVPVFLDTSYYYYYYCGSNTAVPAVGHVSVEVSAIDGRTYQVAVPGLGQVESRLGAPAVLRGASVRTFGPVTISADDQSGSSEFFWSGTDKYRRQTAGFTAMLSESTVTLDPEPETRIIVLDVRQQYWDWDDYYREYYRSVNQTYTYDYNYPTVDMWTRAQKYAVMAIQNYVDDTKKFNVIIAGATPRAVFGSPMPGNPEHIRRAYEAIVQAAPDPAAVTDKALELACAQTVKSAVVLISDLYSPPDYFVSNAHSNYAVSASGAAYDSLIARLGRIVDQSDDVLFTICDEWRVNEFARGTGGTQLASLRWSEYVTYEYLDAAQTRAVAQLPDLFGSSGYGWYWRGITIRSVTAEGLSDLAYTTDSYNNYWARPMVLMRATDYYSPWGNTSTTLRVAGIADRAPRSRGVTVTVSGTLNGLGFTQTFSGTPSPAGSDTGAVEWALVRSEQLAQDDWWSNANAIKAIGKDYHIVTRQTSLLALEPGMELFEDTAVQNSGNETAGASASWSVDMRASPSDSATSAGLTIDNVSLEDLINQVAFVPNQAAAKTVAASTARMVGGRIEIRLGADMSGTVRAELFDMRGRLAGSHEWTDGSVRQVLTWQPANSLGSGRYTLRVKSGSTVRTFRIAAGL
jgi:hypothetical protein